MKFTKQFENYLDTNEDSNASTDFEVSELRHGGKHTTNLYFI